MIITADIHHHYYHKPEVTEGSSSNSSLLDQRPAQTSYGTHLLIGRPCKLKS